jgi:hypothetical protein
MLPIAICCGVLRVGSNNGAWDTTPRPGNTPNILVAHRRKQTGLLRSYVLSGQSESGDSKVLFPRTFDLAHEEAIRPFRRRPLVVLSPHFDDACFSLGQFLLTVGHGSLLNIYTRSTYLADKKAAAGLSPHQVFSIRDEEDKAFATRCNLSRYDVGLKEPSLRGYRVHDLHHLPDEVATDADPVLRVLDEIAEAFDRSERGFLFAPLGVGDHINHRAANQIVLSHLSGIQKRYDVYLYEDQPYSASIFGRLRALSRVGKNRGFRLNNRYVLRSNWQEKRELIDLYPTQRRGKPKAWQFWPKALWPLGPHEAFWSLDVRAPDAGEP